MRPSSSPWDEALLLPRGVSGNIRCYAAGDRGPGVLLMHGANLSAWSFSLLCAKLSRRCRVFAFDARGHGETVLDSAELPTCEVLCSDVDAVIEGFVAPRLGADPIVLVGHSMGGAIAAHVAGSWKHPQRLAGLCVLDVIEGSALAALSRTRAAVAAMPSRFPSIEDAVGWTLDAGMMRLRAAAELSVPHALRPCVHDDSAAETLGNKSIPDSHGVEWAAARFMVESAPCWEGWYTGLTANFLACTPPKLLLLADADSLTGGGSAGLDAPLIAALRQGRFQLGIVTGAGHVLHEDAPDKVAEALLGFLSRHGLTAAVDAELLRERLAAAAAGGSPTGTGRPGRPAS